MALTKLSPMDLKKYKIPEKSTLPVVPGIEYLSDWIDRAHRPKEESTGYPTSTWPAFNEYFGGARSELVIVSGETGMGKTSWVMSWMKDTLDQGRPCCILPLEMGPRDTIDHLSEMVTGKKNNQVGPEDIREFGAALEKWPLFVVDRNGSLPEHEVRAAIYHTALDLGVKFFVIDHLEFIDKPMNYSKTDAYLIDDCVRTLSAIATELKVTIVLIAHPKKRERADQKKAVVLGDLKGTSGIAQTSGSVLVHYRPDEEKDETFIILAKIRSREHAKNRGKRIRFGYDSRYSMYVEAHHA